MVIIAFWAVYEFKDLSEPNPIPHFITLHSWLGLAAIILFTSQVNIHIRSLALIYL